MRRLWDGIDPGTFTTTTTSDEDDTEDTPGRSDEPSDGDRDAVPGRSGSSDRNSAHDDQSTHSASQSANGEPINPSTLLGLPEDANAGEVILVNKRDIMVLQFVVVRLVEKGILDAEEVMRMKRDANKEIRESHPDIVEG
jgi:hypothetical protein